MYMVNKNFKYEASNYKKLSSGYQSQTIYYPIRYRYTIYSLLILKQLVASAMHRHAPVQTGLHPRHFQRIVPQPALHWHDIISTQPSDTLSKNSFIIRRGTSCQSIDYPMELAVLGLVLWLASKP